MFDQSKKHLGGAVVGKPNHKVREELREWAYTSDEWYAWADEATHRRRMLIKKAWDLGDRNVIALARCADVDRNTIYSDVKYLGLTRDMPILSMEEVEDL